MQSDSEKIERAASIARLTHTLYTYWSVRPHLRLAQIVSNAWRIHPDYKKNPEPEIQDVYYFTDKKFLEGLKLLQENESKDSRTSQE
jgi:hypothetical protein